MIFYLTQALVPYLSALDVFRYLSVRAGGAAITGFMLCLIFGPRLIAMLRALKVGQFIKKDHVADLHALHKGKAGTPTMGGAMFILATLISLLLWSNLTNRLLWLVIGVFTLLGAVGFLDDFIKLRRKHNDGLSARAKFAGQILAGLILGIYLVNNPITIGASLVTPRDVKDWDTFHEKFYAAERGEGTPQVLTFWNSFTPEAHTTLLNARPSYNGLRSDYRTTILGVLNNTLSSGNLYDAQLWPISSLTPEGRNLVNKGLDHLNAQEMLRLNRLLLESTFPNAIERSIPNLHTKVNIPGLKDVMIPLGILYIAFVILIIVSVSNAVNLTDGLDGLAAGASIISVFTYALIAYVISRADWSSYLYVIYVPEASELFIFGAALLGAGLGFLWYNAHPAEVFMGDTGSLALGGAIASMAILTKQELLLPIVAGIFVLEAGSVVLQVASYKTTGKRVFRMAPLHHHFELLGWAETKVTLRFWIIGFIFALMSFSTLKFR